MGGLHTNVSIWDATLIVRRIAELWAADVLYLKSCAFGIGPWLDFDCFYGVFNEFASWATLFKTAKPGWKGKAVDVMRIDLVKHIGSILVRLLLPFFTA